MENNLPHGWSTIPLRGIVDINYGKDFRKSNFSKGKGYPVYSANGVIGYSNEFNREDETVVLGCRGSVGSVHLTLPKSYITHNCFSIEPFDKISKKFVYYLLRDVNMSDVITGTAQPQITITNLEPLLVSLPPILEQRRIVAKLDAVMQKVERNKQRLDKIPKLLKRFRQSVLATAVNNDGAKEIAKNVCEEIQIGPFGTQLHRHEYISNGIPLVNPTHIQGGEIIPDMDLTITKTKFKELPNYHLKIGDIIMGRRGEMARCALVGEKENGWLCGTGSLFFRPNLNKINPQYLYWVLSNLNTKAFLEGEAKGSTMSNLNLNIVRNIPFPLPSLEEQKKIVKQVEQLFAFADKIEAHYIKAKIMLDKLPQSILAKAFRGELVPQNPNDEPASVLLERIKVEKQKLIEKKKAKKTKAFNTKEIEVNVAAEKKERYG